MTLSVSDQVPPVGSKLITETEASEIPDNNVTGAAGSLYQLDVDNTGNSDNPAFLKIYDNAAPVVGTDAPDFIFRVPVNQRRSLVVPDGWDFLSLSFACVISGGTAGQTPPTNPVVVKMVTT
jgi:hypothetical protein